MAIIRSQVSQIIGQDTRVYDVIAESASDLTVDTTRNFAVGSLALCLAESKLYIKASNGAWTEVDV